MDTLDLRKWPSFKGRDSLIDQITIDSREITSKNSLFIALPGKTHDGHSFVDAALAKGAKYVVVKESYEREHPQFIKVKDPLRALQELSQIYREEKKIPIVAITGSYGKTMVKDFLHFLLKKRKNVFSSPESFNSQIGVALTLLQIEEQEIALIEAGISEVGEMDFLASMIKPTHSILTSTKDLSPSLIFEKIKLLTHVPEDNWILCPDHCSSADLKAKKHYLDLVSAELPYAEKIASSPFIFAFKVIFPSKKVYHYSWSFVFPYSLELLNIVIKAATLLGMGEEDLSSSLGEYLPEPMQTEMWHSRVGTTFINAPYSADPISVHLALKKLESLKTEKGKKIFIFGGLRTKQMTKAHIQKLATTLHEYKPDLLILVGKHLEGLVELLKVEPSYLDEEEALRALYPTLQKEDTVLIQGPTKKTLRELSKNLNDLLSATTLTIHLSHIEKNLEAYQGKRILCMVKAHGYGTDPVILSKFLQSKGITIIGVAHPDEALFLRQNQITQSIFVIHTPLYEMKKAIKGDFEVALSSEEEIDTLNLLAASHHKKMKVHLHIDTGMSRLGCRPQEALLLATKIAHSNALIFEGVMTHFACADIEEEDPFTHSQAKCFRRCVKELNDHGIYPRWVHAENSSGANRSFFPEGNMIRIGLALFGLSAANQKPALSLTSRIVGINHCKKNDTISYGRNYQIKQEDARIAVIPLGYFDGLHRHFSGKSDVLIRGIKAPMAGNICMDFMMVDISHIEDAQIGDPVLIFGEDSHGNKSSLLEFAERVGTNAHELITCLGPRIQRIFVEN